MLGIEDVRLPAMDAPVLVAAFSGWVDAGYSGQGALGYLMTHAEGVDEVASVDLSSVVDLNANRPQVRVVDGFVSDLDWPGLKICTAVGDRDLLLVAGPEPSLRWSDLVDSLCELAVRAGVSEAYFLGGMPGAVTHDEPVEVLATATDAALGARLGSMRPDYTGPTGIQTVLQSRIADAGVPAGGLWAQVPPYVSATPSPPAIRALLLKLSAVTGVGLNLAPLVADTERWTKRVEQTLRERPELSELVDRLREAIGDGPVSEAEGLPIRSEDMPSGDELAREIERFLRDQD